MMLRTRRTTFPVVMVRFRLSAIWNSCLRVKMAKRRVFQEHKRSYSERIVGKRLPAEKFLIVCEGEETEPNYFRSFRVPREVAVIKGLGDNTKRIVEAAISLGQEDDYDQVWCVFDRDSFKTANFNDAFFLAQKNRIKIADRKSTRLNSS